MKKVVNDRRASLDVETEIKPAMEKLVQQEFDRGKTIPIIPFPKEGTEITDSPKLTLVVADPYTEWTGNGAVRDMIAEWTKLRGKSPRLYPGALVWCVKKPGRDLRDKVELWLAWKRVAHEIAEGTLGGEFDKVDHADIRSKVAGSEEAAKDEVWAGYRFAVIFAEASQPLPDFNQSRSGKIKKARLQDKIAYDSDRKVIFLKAELSDSEKHTLIEELPDIKETLDRLFKIADQGVFIDGLRAIDLGAGHSSSGQTLCGRVIEALKREALLNESVGAGYIERNWPPALKECGAWPLASLRQSFLNGSLTRLLDPDAILRSKITEFVMRGDFGLASDQKQDGSYERVWFEELLPIEEVAFESDVFLLIKKRAEQLKAGIPKTSAPIPESTPIPSPLPSSAPKPDAISQTIPESKTRTIRLTGSVPPEVWNRLGTRILPKLRSGIGLRIGIDFVIDVDESNAGSLCNELRLIIEDLGLTGTVRIE